MPEWTCTSCDYDANEESSKSCESCGEAAPATSTSASPPSTSPLIVVACIISLEPVPKKDKLRVAMVDAGPISGQVSIVTNAPNVVVGSLVVVALPGALVRSGTEDILVSVATVGGVKSSGMLCDAPMLGWAGGGAGTAALVPADTFKPGDAPPTVRPRAK